MSYQHLAAQAVADRNEARIAGRATALQHLVTDAAEVADDASAVLPAGHWIAAPVGWGEASPTSLASTAAQAWLQLADEIGDLEPYDLDTRAALGVCAAPPGN